MSFTMRFHPNPDTIFRMISSPVRDLFFNWKSCQKIFPLKINLMSFWQLDFLLLKHSDIQSFGSWCNILLWSHFDILKLYFYASMLVHKIYTRKYYSSFFVMKTALKFVIIKSNLFTCDAAIINYKY